MLPGQARLRRRADFDLVVRRGRRVGRRTMVVHILPAAEAHEMATSPQIGFVVSSKVGTAVQRHRATRQLRHLVRARLDRLPAGSRVVVRALPSIRGRSSADLGTDLDSALESATRGRP